MKIYLAGGYIEDTAKKLFSFKANRLFSFYDIIEKRVNMNQRFKKLIQKINSKDKQ